MSKRFRKRCKPLLSSYNSKFITNYNWICGVYEKNKICEISNEDINLDCLLMTKNTIKLCDAYRVLVYNRGENGIIKENLTFGFWNSKVTAVAYCNDVIITGHFDGSIRLWTYKSRGKKNYPQHLKTYYNVYNNPVYKIDATSQYIISSSKNSTKIHKNIHEENSFVEEIKIFDNFGVNSVLFDPTKTKFAINIWKRSNLSFNSFVLYDINKSCQIINKKIDDSCYQSLWEDSNTVLMRYSKYIKKMDIRTEKFVSIWDASYIGSLLRCLSSDNTYTFMTGTDVSQILLWDQRRSNLIRRYNVGTDHDDTEHEVFSVQFDSTYMYAATEEGLIEYDFKGINHYSQGIKEWLHSGDKAVLEYYYFST